MTSPAMIDYLMRLVAHDIKECDKGILMSVDPGSYENRKDLALQTAKELQELRNNFGSMGR